MERIGLIWRDDGGLELQNAEAPHFSYQRFLVRKVAVANGMAQAYALCDLAQSDAVHALFQVQRQCSLNEGLADALGLVGRVDGACHKSPLLLLCEFNLSAFFCFVNSGKITMRRNRHGGFSLGHLLTN
ncbi:hypothetical protein D3C78_1602490 [compost metagenome]